MKSTALNFKFPEYRLYQKEVMEQVAKWFNEGIEVVVIEGPTGFGKSPVNMNLGLDFAPSYYTTPQKKLRQQLSNDFGPKELVIDGYETDICVLKARSDYICRASGLTSDKCWIYKDPNESCIKNPNCVYWKQKEGIFNSEVGILTFAAMIINKKYLKVFIETSEGKQQISFEDRNLLIVDECHSLEGQVASKHAGFTISPSFIPKQFNDIPEFKFSWERLKEHIPTNINNIRELYPLFDKIEQLLNEWKKNKSTKKYYEDDPEYKIQTIRDKIDQLRKDTEKGLKWFGNVSYKNRFKSNIIELKPEKIDKFLQKYMWSYGDKILLTSATIPFSNTNNISKWLKKIGLGNKSYKFKQIPPVFPKEIRPIYLKYGGSLSSTNDEERKKRNWNSCVQKVKDILDTHKGLKGVIHPGSYNRGTRLYNSLNNSDICLHLKDEKVDIIEKWIKSKKNILISPAIFEGVDLKYDLCRFQILFKVLYGNLADKRIKYLMNKDYNWYRNETIIKILQAYGRAVRAEDDFAEFYIIDSAFKKLRSYMPDWFEKAIMTKTDMFGDDI